jgi:hypothetical protein
VNAYLLSGTGAAPFMSLIGPAALRRHGDFVHGYDGCANPRWSITRSRGCWRSEYLGDRVRERLILPDRYA